MRRFGLTAITIYLMIAVLLAAPLKVRAEDETENETGHQYKILFLSSYGYSNAAVPPQLEGFEEGLEGLNVDISYEFMDSDKYYGGLDIQNFDKYLRYKVFSIRDYDLIAVADDPALRYAINNRSVLFPDVPMVFMGINSKTEAVTAAAMQNATGIVESPDFESNYQLMKFLFPKRDHINVVVDSSVAGQGDYVEFMKFKEANPDISSTIINTSYYTAAGLRDLLASLGAEDIILFLDFTIDGEKNSYSLENAAQFLSDNAPSVPIFRVASSNIEHGVFGGVSYSYYDAGKMAGEVSARILQGESADDIPLMSSTLTSAYFEQGRMDFFGIKHALLPPGSTVINEHQNLAKFYRENRVISNLMMVIIILLFAIIFILNISNNHRKRAIRTDFLTQMPNRKKLMEDIAVAELQASSYGLIMLDVDHFKTINDTFGHKVGDEIIQGVGERLKGLAGKDIIFARLGGDEFCGLFTSTDKNKGESICKDIMQITEKEFKTSAGRINISVSVGCATYPVDTKDKHAVMECADRALYVTKENGRNGYTLFGSIDKSG